MQLSSKEKRVFPIFSAYLKDTENFEYFLTKDDPQRLFVSENIDCKKRGYFKD